MGLRANLSLFRSRHALYAALGLVAVFAALRFELPRPWHAGGAHGAMLVSGWATLGGMLIVLGYVLRKYMHKLGYSPEFRRKVGLKELEAFQGRLNDLRLEVLKNQLREASAIRARLPAVLAGVDGVMRVELEHDAAGGPPRLVERPAEPFGRTARWLHAHLYFGLFFASLVLVHGRAGLNSPLGGVLNALALLLTLTGLVGITLWSLGPTWLSQRERAVKLSIEQAFVFKRHYRQKVKDALLALDEGARPALAAVWAARKAHDFPERARQALLGPAFARPETLVAGRDLLVLIGQYRRVAAALSATWRVRFAYMAWRYVHIPVALLLLGCAGLHLFSVWKY